MCLFVCVCVCVSLAFRKRGSGLHGDEAVCVCVLDAMGTIEHVYVLCLLDK